LKHNKFGIFIFVDSIMSSFLS